MSRHRNPSDPILAPVSIGELIDKIVILEIKLARITDTSKRAEIVKELNLLNQIDYGAVKCRQQIQSLREELRQVNEALWDIEDRIRDCERGQDFGPRFVEFARAVYKTNDRRSALKRRINEVSGSAIVEIKAHPAY
jgi:predicted  nucleic acid-binding Zn-ribbon protein